MISIETGFQGLLLWQGAQKHFDNRGSLRELFTQQDLPCDFDTYQINHTYSVKNVVRGLHYQTPPHAQAKIIHVIKGEILDIALDLRQSSATYGKYFKAELSTKNCRHLYMPKGFAHGFSVTGREAVVIYQVDAPYGPASCRCIKYDDKLLNIDWRLTDWAVISAADADGVPFEEYLKNPVF
jgi:dTDP-4-dehydrorhamnose 3,5-epimerase